MIEYAFFILVIPPYLVTSANTLDFVFIPIYAPSLAFAATLALYIVASANAPDCSNKRLVTRTSLLAIIFLTVSILVSLFQAFPSCALVHITS